MVKNFYVILGIEMKKVVKIDKSRIEVVIVIIKECNLWIAQFVPIRI